MTNEVTFLPSPFCGIIACHVESARAPDDGYMVVCDACHACGPLGEDEAEAIEEWNDRS